MVGTVVSIVVSILTCAITIITVSRKLITKEDLRDNLAGIREDIKELSIKIQQMDGQVGSLRERVAVLESLQKRKE